MGIPGQRSRRGQGELYDQPKTEHVLILLTPAGRKLLDQKVADYNQSLDERISRSEFIERWVRGLIISK
ncbi:hypothetical protein [Halomicronema sp. CCY15110]|uniref:hypothetical protein n=1 Tax=Halomicronema sp. CCY15110 TaxID=2767773 RepID=UPI00194DE39D|nr:hypothetical protein [Halomicronema sp. CCY15110]